MSESLLFLFHLLYPHKNPQLLFHERIRFYIVLNNGMNSFSLSVPIWEESPMTPSFSMALLVWILASLNNVHSLYIVLFFYLFSIINKYHSMYRTLSQNVTYNFEVIM